VRFPAPVLGFCTTCFLNSFPGFEKYDDKSAWIISEAHVTANATGLLNITCEVPLLDSDQSEPRMLSLNISKCPSDPNEALPTQTILVIVASTITAAVIITISSVLIIKRIKHNSNHKLTEKDIQDFYHGFLDPHNKLRGALVLAYDKKLEIPRKDVILG